MRRNLRRWFHFQRTCPHCPSRYKTFPLLTPTGRVLRARVLPNEPLPRFFVPLNMLQQVKGSSLLKCKRHLQYVLSYVHPLNRAFMREDYGETISAKFGYLTRVHYVGAFPDFYAGEDITGNGQEFNRFLMENPYYQRRPSWRR